MAILRQYVPVACTLLAGLISGCASAAGVGTTDDLPPHPARLGTIVTSEDFDRSPGQSIEQELEAHIPGITLSQTADGSVSVRIRGVNTFLGSTEPLYVIDGIPVQAGPGGGLTGINAHDIASIEVLKDPVSESFYGVRGGNGVIVIRTKHSH
jgi:TonB-dependent SusC/RagA subfamily outer membrane receptor